MLVDVALPLPIPQTFVYRVDRAVAEGVRVLVPFGKRRLIGWVVRRDATPPEGARVRGVRKVLDEHPTVDPDLLALCRWIADYYVAPLGLVLRSALPNLLSDTDRPQPPVKTRRVLRLARALPSLRQRDELFGRAHRQRECYELLESSGGAVEVAHLTDHLGFSYSVLRGLESKGLVRFADEEVERDPFADIVPEPASRPPLTPAQRAAVDTLISASRTRRGPREPATFLLRGVTGSGKTRVYIELLREVVGERGGGAIVLVPEIALTPQTVARFRSHFGDDVAVLHSALSDGERYDAWRALRAGERRIAVGARSAIFAPVRDLGAIIVDEEHESTYKQSEAPRYHAREVAIMRALSAGAVCVVGSATPSLESWHNAESGKFRLLELPERVEGRPLPAVRVVDLKAGRRTADGRPDRADARRARRPSSPTILTPELEREVRDRLERDEQTILLLNRRGYSTFVQCRECGAVWQCEQCNVSLTFHRTRRRLVCHYCFHEEPPPARCDACGSDALSFRGVGTEQVERAIGEAFPTARIARMDVDTTSGKWSHHEILGRVERREIDILLGTQMIAKGLDFPHVTLVGVVNADVGMNLPDFRASERTFQLLTQVAGRAGRGERAGTVIVQTALPDHYAIRAALRHDYTGFVERELERRREPLYPPYCRLANVVVSGLEEAPVQAGIQAVADATAAFMTRETPAVQLVGPAPCVIDRIRGRWRWHFLLRSPHAGQLGAVCHRVQQETPGGGGELRLIVDRDPVALL